MRVVLPSRTSGATRTDGSHLSGPIARQLDGLCADFLKQMGTFCFAKTTSIWRLKTHELDGRGKFPPVLMTKAVNTA